MERKRLTRELDFYIEQNYHSEGFKLKDFFDAISEGRAFVAGKPNIDGAKWALDFLLKNMELTFTEKLFKLIEEKKKKPAEVYTEAGISRFNFSKIKSDKDYHPTKETALALAVALHLDLEETSDLIKRAGYSLSHSSESDLIVEFFIDRGVYNIDEINYQLDFRGHKTLTHWRKSKDE